jgi:hypothetical protein
MSSNDG